MIDKKSRLPIDFLVAFAVQFALTKYPVVTNGIPFRLDMRELMMMIVFSFIAAFLIENLIWRIKRLRSK